MNGVQVEVKHVAILVSPGPGMSFSGWLAMLATTHGISTSGIVLVTRCFVLTGRTGVVVAQFLVICPTVLAIVFVRMRVAGFFYKSWHFLCKVMQSWL